MFEGNRISTLQIQVNDLNRSAIFYGETLALKRSSDAAQTDATSFIFEAGCVRLQLVQIAEGGTERPLPSAIWHLCFRAQGIDAIVARLRAANTHFAIEPMNAKGGINACFFTDPDGLVIELTEGDLNFDDGPAKTVPSRIIAPGEIVIDHVAIDVTDVGKATENFSEQLGLKPLGKIDMIDQGFDITYFSDGKMRVEAFHFLQGGPLDLHDDAERWRFGILVGNPSRPGILHDLRIERDGRIAIAAESQCL